MTKQQKLPNNVQHYDVAKLGEDGLRQSINFGAIRSPDSGPQKFEIMSFHSQTISQFEQGPENYLNHSPMADKALFYTTCLQQLTALLAARPPPRPIA